jgi:hypothetical protein
MKETRLVHRSARAKEEKVECSGFLYSLFRNLEEAVKISFNAFKALKGLWGTERFPQRRRTSNAKEEESAIERETNERGTEEI